MKYIKGIAIIPLQAAYFTLFFIVVLCLYLPLNMLGFLVEKIEGI